MALLELFLYKRPGGDESIPGMNQTHSHDQNFRGSFPECFANLFRNNSFVDIWLTQDGDYAYHWERRRQTGEIYRWDNAPHHPQIRTFPDHLHDSDEQIIVESHLNPTTEEALREILEFVQQRL